MWLFNYFRKRNFINMFKKEFYIIKVWLSTILFSPFLIFLFSWILLKKDIDAIFGAFKYYLLYAAIGFLFSIPSIIIFGYLYRYLTKRNVTLVQLNLYLCIFSIFSIFTSFYFLGINFLFSNIVFPISYSFVTCLSIIFINKNYSITSSIKS